MSAPATFDTLATNEASGLTTTVASEGVTIKLTVNVHTTLHLDLTSTEAPLTVESVSETAGQTTEDSVTKPLSTQTAVTTSALEQTSRRPVQTLTTPNATTITANTSLRTATSADQPVNSLVPSTHTSALSRHVPTDTHLPTASIIGISIGSGIAAFLLGLCLFFLLRFCIRRAKRQRHRPHLEVPERRDRYETAVAVVPGRHGKAELPDVEYIQRLERNRSGASQVPPQVPTELATRPRTPGPHELPCNEMMRPRSQESWDFRTPETLRKF